jgi:hypothetical protein
MKNIKSYIVEHAVYRYWIQYVDKDGNLMKLPSAVAEKPEGATYYEIWKGSATNWSDPEGLVAWGGDNGYWAYVIDTFEKDGKHPSFRKSEIEHIKKLRK